MLKWGFRNEEWSNQDYLAIKRSKKKWKDCSGTKFSTTWPNLETRKRLRALKASQQGL